MNETISDKTYPIEKIWILERALITLLFLIISSPFYLNLFARNNVNLEFLIYPVVQIGAFIYWILLRNSFHYSLDPEYLKIEQGILSKQERHIPYGVIQNVFVSQGIMDRVFGITSLTLENASGGGGSQDNNQLKSFKFTMFQRKDANATADLLGSTGNKVRIPGLKKDNAGMLKIAILSKMKDLPANNQSGL